MVPQHSDFRLVACDDCVIFKLDLMLIKKMQKRCKVMSQINFTNSSKK